MLALASAVTGTAAAGASFQLSKLDASIPQAQGGRCMDGTGFGPSGAEMGGNLTFDNELLGQLSTAYSVAPASGAIEPRRRDAAGRGRQPPPRSMSMS